MSPADEIVAIVNDHNEVVGSATRAEMRRKRLPHRCTYILVFNSSGELFVQKRTMDKDVFPGYLDPAAGGVVLSGETYNEGAKRELSEELGIRGVPLTPHFVHRYDDGQVTAWGAVFSCTYDGPLTLQKEEVLWGEFVRVAAVLERAKTEPFTPDGMLMLTLYLEKSGRISPSTPGEP